MAHAWQIMFQATVISIAIGFLVAVLIQFLTFLVNRHNHAAAPKPEDEFGEVLALAVALSQRKKNQS